MTDPDTSPEAVERLAQMLETDASDQNFMPDELTGLLPDNEYEIAATLRALSAERAALKSQLAEAVGVLQMIVGGAVYTAADGFSKPHEPEQSRIARAFLARHQKGQTNAPQEK